MKMKILSILIPLLILPSIAMTQMFSIEDAEERSGRSTSSISVGPDFIDMSFRGNDDEAVQYNWNDAVYRIRLEIPGVNAYVGYNSSIGDADTLTYFNAGANLQAGTPLITNSSYGIIIPLQIITDYVKVESTDSAQPEMDHFRQSSLAAGLGIGFYYQFQNTIRLEVEAVPKIGFTVSAFGSDAGQIRGVSGRVRFKIDEIINRYGLVAGFDYVLRSYSGGDDLIDHNISSNNFVVGISF